MFGTVVERNVVVLIDTSGSMQASMEELKRELTSLVWEQLHKHGCRSDTRTLVYTCARCRHVCTSSFVNTIASVFFFCFFLWLVVSLNNLTIIEMIVHDGADLPVLDST